MGWAYIITSIPFKTRLLLHSVWDWILQLVFDFATLILYTFIFFPWTLHVLLIHFSMIDQRSELISCKQRVCIYTMCLICVWKPQTLAKEHVTTSLSNTAESWVAVDVITQTLSVFFIVVPCIFITLKFLWPTNALLYYTYKMLKYTVKISHDCSYMFRSIWTIVREPVPNLAKVTILCR